MVVSKAANGLPSRLHVQGVCSDSKTPIGNLKKHGQESFLCINRNDGHSSSTGFPQNRKSNFDNQPRHIGNI